MFVRKEGQRVIYVRFAVIGFVVGLLLLITLGAALWNFFVIAYSAVFPEDGEVED